MSPRSAENVIVGWSGTTEDKPELLVKLTAAPADGKANDALVKLLAKEFCIAKSNISIKSGHTSRHKLLQIQEESPQLLKCFKQLPLV